MIRFNIGIPNVELLFLIVVEISQGAGIDNLDTYYIDN